MTAELVALVLGLGFTAVLVAREFRLRRPNKTVKTLKAVGARLDKLEAGLSEMDGFPEVLAELEARLGEAEAKAGTSAPVQLKVLVDRVNAISNDAMALKAAADSLENRFTRLEQGTKWKAALVREPTGG